MARIVAALLSALLFGATRASAQAPPPVVADQCMSCHGTTDRPGDPTVPIIAGQQYAYLLRALRAYRNGDRGGSQQAADMTQIAKGLAFEDLPVVAEFYSNLRSVRW